MGSESVKIVAFRADVSDYHRIRGVRSAAVSDFIHEMEKLGAEAGYARSFAVPTCQVYVSLAVELPGGTCLNSEHEITFDDLEKYTDYPASDHARATTRSLIDQMGIYVTDEIEEALKAKQTAFLPTGVRFRGFEIVLKADRSNSSHASADAIRSLKYAVRDLIDSDPWELTDEAVVTGVSLGTVPFLTCGKGATADPKNPDILYVLAGVNYRGFPVSLKFTPNVGVEHVDVARAAIALREVIESSKDDWRTVGA